MQDQLPQGIRSLAVYRIPYKGSGLFRRRNPREPVEKRLFDPEGNPIEEETPLGKRIYRREEGRTAGILHLTPEGEKESEELLEYDDRGRLLVRILRYENPAGEERTEYTYEQGGRLTLEHSGGRIRAVQRDRSGRTVKELLYTGESPDAVTQYRYDERDRVTEIRRSEAGGGARTVEKRSYDEEGLLSEVLLENGSGRVLQHLKYDYPSGGGLAWLECRVWSLFSEQGGRKRLLHRLMRELAFYPDGNIDSHDEGPGTEAAGETEADPSGEGDQGDLQWEDGKYRGPFRQGKMHGRGTFFFRDGSRYEGDFREGKMEGEGTLHLPDGRIYRGGFSGNRMEGRGECLWPNGDRYAGSFRNNKMHGLGTFTWSDGRSFQGWFEDNRRTDQGVFSAGD